LFLDDEVASVQQAKRALARALPGTIERYTEKLWAQFGHWGGPVWRKINFVGQRPLPLLLTPIPRKRFVQSHFRFREASSSSRWSGE
jgi:hypothetical protein